MLIRGRSRIRRCALAREARRMDLKVYEHSLGLALCLLFLASWIGHAIGG